MWPIALGFGANFPLPSDAGDVVPGVTRELSLLPSATSTTQPQAAAAQPRGEVMTGGRMAENRYSSDHSLCSPGSFLTTGIV